MWIGFLKTDKGERDSRLTGVGSGPIAREGEGSSAGSKLS
jgi:hypothetical protein